MEISINKEYQIGWGSTVLALAAVTFQGYNLNSEAVCLNYYMI